MIDPELAETYKRLTNQWISNKRATRFGSFTLRFGLLLFFISFTVIIPVFLQVLLGIPFFYTLAGSGFIGLLLMLIGSRSIRKNEALAPRLSPNEEAFLNVFEALEKIDAYLNAKDGIEFSRLEATKKLSKARITLAEPSRSSQYLWMALTKDLDGGLRLLKRNLKEILLPIVSKGKKGELQKAYPVIEKLAKLFLSPTVQALEDLNNEMPPKPSYVEKKVLLISAVSFLKRHSILQYAFIELVFAFVGFLAYYIGTASQILPRDQAFYLAWIIWATLTAGYMAIIARKR